MRSFKHVLIVGALAATVLGGCGGHKATRIASQPAPVTSSTTTTLVPPGFGRAVENYNRAKFFAGLGMIVAAEREAALKVERSRSATAPVMPSRPAVAPSGGHSDAWWHGVAICEQGGRNDPYFGYFSYMDGSAGGGMSWADQVAKGNRTIARVGDHAWASACVAAGYRASPGG